jgi:hypothetical protein
MLIEKLGQKHLNLVNLLIYTIDYRCVAKLKNALNAIEPANLT